MSVVTGQSPLQKLIASGYRYSRKLAFEKGRDACVAYARAAYANRGDPILLLLADDLTEVEFDEKGPATPDAGSDLEALAKLRAHPYCEQLFQHILGDFEGEETELAQAAELLLKLLRGDARPTPEAKP